MRGQLIFWMMFMMRECLIGQVTLFQGAGKPTVETAMKEGDWYLDTIAHKATYFQNGNWIEKEERDVVAVDLCNGKALLHVLDRLVVYGSKGEPLSNGSFGGYHCADTSLWVWGGGRREQPEWVSWSMGVFSPVGSNWLPCYYRTFSPWGDTDFPDTVQGMVSFCVVPRNQIYGTFSPREWRSWGIFGTNGKWLIEPKFDAPFHFQNGVAEVLYYGQKRKINEKGEFVE